MPDQTTTPGIVRSITGTGDGPRPVVLSGTAPHGDDFEVHVFNPDPDSDDASTMYVLEALGSSIMLRRRRLPGGGYDTVVEISDTQGPIEVYVRGTATRHD